MAAKMRDEWKGQIKVFNDSEDDFRVEIDGETLAIVDKGAVKKITEELMMHMEDVVSFDHMYNVALTALMFANRKMKGSSHFTTEDDNAVRTGNEALVLSAFQLGNEHMFG